MTGNTVWYCSTTHHLSHGSDKLSCMVWPNIVYLDHVKKDVKDKTDKTCCSNSRLARTAPKPVCPHCRDAKQGVEFTFFYLVRARNNHPEGLRDNMALIWGDWSSWTPDPTSKGFSVSTLSSFGTKHICIMGTCPLQCSNSLASTHQILKHHPDMFMPLALLNVETQFPSKESLGSEIGLLVVYKSVHHFGRC